MKGLSVKRCAACLIFAFLSSTTAAQETEIGGLSVDEIDAFFESYVSSDPSQEKTAPGAHLAIVDLEGRLMLRGYGVAGSPTAGRDPMDPRRHLFRIASQTKTITAIGVLQLYEQGLLNLNDPVNKHLQEIQLSQPFGPVTIRHLLLHSSGVDDDWTGAGKALRTPEEHQPLVESLKAFPPTFRWEPGLVSSYTNRSFMLLGHLIEAVSGMPYEDYVQRNILDVLGMDNSTFVLSESQQKDLAWGTIRSEDGYQEFWMPDTQTRPSGDLMSTAEDMSKFIGALLNDGSYEGRRILKAETHQQMLEDCQRVGPGHAVYCLGLIGMLYNGVPVPVHGGNHTSYKSAFIIDRERGLALYYGFLSDTMSGTGFYGDFVDRFYPLEQAPLVADAIDRGDEISGWYRRSWSSFHSIDKLAFLFAGDTRVSVEGDYLLIGDKRYVQTGPLTFRNPENPDDYRVFIENAEGDISHFSPSTHWKRPWYESVALARTLLVFVTLFSLLYVVMQARRRQPADAPTPGLRWTRTALLAPAALWLGGLSLIVLGIAAFLLFGGEAMDMIYSRPRAAELGLLVLKLITIAVPLAVIAGVMLIGKGGLGRYEKALQSTATLSALALLWVSTQWNLI
ncbi:MAG: serine hydrolase domain-containing protein [Pseudomonadota bacterium]